MELKYSKQPSNSCCDINNYKVWENESLPLGNGYFGVSVFGCTDIDRFQITENSFCNPYLFDKENPGLNYGVTSFADIFLEFRHKEISNYKRILSLDKSLLTVEYDYKGTHFKRECFASYIDKVFALKISSNKKESVNFKIFLKIPNIGKHFLNEKDLSRTGETLIENDTIKIVGNLAYYNVDYVGLIKIKNNGGKIIKKDDCLEIIDSNETEIIFSCGTNYKLDKSIFLIDNPKEKLEKDNNLKNRIQKTVNDALSIGFNELYKRHYKDYAALFNRVSFYLNDEKESDLDTPELIQNYKKGLFSSYLETLLFQFGRYLLICSSRKGCLPSNLQGIWSSYKSSPWSAGYWHNINVQMNYWPTGPANLTDLFLSYSDYALAYLEKASKIADEYIKENYPNKFENNHNGWIIGTGGWPYLIGGYEKKSHSGPGTGAFTSLLFYDYYNFTMDEKYLKDIAYPLLYKMSEFLIKTLVCENGVYLVEFSASPENVNREDSNWNDYHFTKGCAFDQQMIYENFKATLKCAEILKIKDDSLIKEIHQIINKLEPIIIGDSGQVKEYREEHQYAEFGEKNHRHISQLVGLYPGTQFSALSKKNMDAAIFTLNARGDKSTGWALMHRLCLWSRTGMANRAMDIIHSFISNKVLDNLWDSHPPFQIDGNFGYTAGISEMLLQSHEGYINLLPTIPKEWEKGEVKGLLARGAFEVDIKFEKNALKSAVIKSLKGGECKIINKDYNFSIKPLSIDENNIAVFSTKIGDEIIINNNANKM